MLCCRSLEAGQSGSIVYVIDANTHRYYRIGQLIGECVRPASPDQDPVYRAVVLRQALDQFEEEHFYDVKNLRPLGQPDFKDGKAADLIPDLVHV